MKPGSWLVVMLLGLSQPVMARHAADGYFDPAEMAKVRAALAKSHGDQIHSLIMAERFEIQTNDGDSLTVWEGHGWIGGDEQRLWFKTEGEYENDDSGFEEAELQALYSRAIRPFWDLQMGLRHDFKPEPTRSYGVIGVHGLAPYWFELDGQLFLSDEGDLTMRFEAEYEFRLTQRLMLQPRIELNVAFSEDEEIEQGSGLSTADVGLRLRYEIIRQFAPYVGVSWTRAFGNTADFVRSDGGSRSQTSLVAGVRFWF